MKWCSSSVVTVADPSPPTDVSSERKLALIAATSGSEQPWDIAAETENRNNKSARTRLRRVPPIGLYVACELGSMVNYN